MIHWFRTPAVAVRFDQVKVFPVGDGDPVVHFIRGAAKIHGTTSENVLVDDEGQPVPNASRDPWTPEEQTEMEEQRRAYIRSMSCD